MQFDYSWLWRCVSVAKNDYDQHTLDEIHGIDTNNRDCALSTIVEPVVGSLDNQGLSSVCCGAIVVCDAVGTKASNNRFAVDLVDMVEKIGRKRGIV
ncbi:hypothetical protein IVG45_03915 [Methylomonas sp. LL1]|uniref:hypothetical protein n=1 Tax=Methylomonas sp. LL1 TaxID=2785785 RepID=UPI0018C37691|nr:hypothetical protein [Methylomonas sp. LL1]QPK64128.1 hypothetical protein IVG45_03915 [Methylomonas sp. LL1]